MWLGDLSNNPESKQAEPHGSFVAKEITDVLAGEIQCQLPQSTRFVQTSYFLC